MSDLLELLIKTNTVNFIIVAAFVIFLFFKLNIKDKLQNVCNDIKSYVENSENDKATAEKELNIINEKIKRLPALIERIKKSSENNVSNIAEKIKNETENKKKDIQSNAERILNLETKKFKSKLIDLLSEKSIELVSKNTQSQFNENPDLHNKYIDAAIEEIDRINL